MGIKAKVEQLERRAGKTEGETPHFIVVGTDAQDPEAREHDIEAQCAKIRAEGYKGIILIIDR